MPGQCRGTPSFHASTPAPSPSPWTRVQTKTEGEMENPVQAEAVRPTHWMSQRSRRPGQDRMAATAETTTLALCCWGNEFCIVWIRACSRLRMDIKHID